MNAPSNTPPVVRTTCPYCGVGCGVLASPDGRGGAMISESCAGGAMISTESRPGALVEAVAYAGCTAAFAVVLDAYAELLAAADAVDA